MNTEQVFHNLHELMFDGQPSALHVCDDIFQYTFEDYVESTVHNSKSSSCLAVGFGFYSCTLFVRRPADQDSNEIIQSLELDSTSSKQGDQLFIEETPGLAELLKNLFNVLEADSKDEKQPICDLPTPPVSPRRVAAAPPQMCINADLSVPCVEPKSYKVVEWNTGSLDQLVHEAKQRAAVTCDLPAALCLRNKRRAVSPDVKCTDDGEDEDEDDDDSFADCDYKYKVDEDDEDECEVTELSSGSIYAAPSVAERKRAKHNHPKTAAATASSSSSSVPPRSRKTQKNRETYHVLCGLNFHAGPLQFRKVPLDDDNNNYVCVEGTGEAHVTDALRSANFSILSDTRGRRLVFIKKLVDSAVHYIYIGQEGHPLTGLCSTTNGPDFNKVSKWARTCGPTCGCNNLKCSSFQTNTFCSHAGCTNSSLLGVLELLRSRDIYYALSLRKAGRNKIAPMYQSEFLPRCSVPTISPRRALKEADFRLADGLAISKDLEKIAAFMTKHNIKPRGS